MGDEAVLLAVVLVRLGVPLLIPRFPLPAILTALVVDAADQSIFQRATDLDLDGYQGYDKALDVYYLAIAYLSTIRSWTDPVAQHVAAFLWYYRLVGVVAFELLDERFLLFLFPNTFEYFFIAYEAVRVRWDPRRLGRRALLGLAAFIWIFIKLPQEWWIHIAQLDFTDVMKEDVFGVSVDTSWGEAIGQNLWFVALLVLVAGLVVVGLRWLRPRLPGPDWPLTFAVGRHLDPVPASVATPVPWWSARVGEKVALVALVCVIFAQVLPGVDRGPVQTALAAAVIVLANAAVSQWLVGRGVRWRSTVTQFVAMALLNLVVIGVFAVVGRNPGEDRNEAAVAFFALLMALLVTLYDRYRDERAARASLADGALTR